MGSRVRDAKAVKQGRRNRQRGAEGEREVCSLLSAEFGHAVKRRLGQERDSGHDVDLPGFTVEVKRRKAIAGLYVWLEQAGSTQQPPAVLARADCREWLAVMRLSDWVRLARKEFAASGDDQKGAPTRSLWPNVPGGQPHSPRAAAVDSGGLLCRPMDEFGADT
jgi:hypothetical protein